MSYRVLVINPGSTSTKFAVYEDENPILVKGIEHNADEISKFNNILDQYEMRKEQIQKVLHENNIDLKTMDTIVGRCGGLPPVKSGAYKINDAMIERLRTNPTLDHASNLGAVISYSLANEIGVNSYIYDPVCVDECIDIARPSGLKGMDRHCLTHALNTRAMAIEYAKMNNKE